MTTTVYELAVNADGTQHTAYKDGDAPVDVLDAPTKLAVQAETSTTITMAFNYNDTGHTGFEWQQWIGGESFEWSAVAMIGKDDRAWTATGLPVGMYIGHRVRAYNDSSVSPWSLEVWTVTPPVAA